jgi:hypothetical protein
MINAKEALKKSDDNYMKEIEEDILHAIGRGVYSTHSLIEHCEFEDVKYLLEREGYTVTTDDELTTDYKIFIEISWGREEIKNNKENILADNDIIVW